MRIAVYFPQKMALSMRHYAENVARHLADEGVECIFFGKTDPIPQDVDLYWDPRSGGGNPPPQRLRFVKKPIVMTIHGASFNTEYARTERWKGWRRPLLWLIIQYRLLLWIGFRHKIKAYITVSHYAARQLAEAVKIQEDRIHVVHHGVDHQTFFVADEPVVEKSYLLHVSSGSHRLRTQKNIPRILQAYAQVELPNKPPLRLIIAGYTAELPEDVPGVQLIRETMSHAMLAEQYQQALGFVFPSLQETFGMPILEAMASGCPVITAEDNACGEVAGDAALLVNPRSVKSISDAMQKLILDADLRKDLRQKGLQRASQFTWKKAAAYHLEIFRHEEV